jgi:hypothetical protein
MPRRWRFSRCRGECAPDPRNAACVVTMDDAGAELRDTDIRIDNGEIIELGQGLEDGPVIDARGCLVTPGLVNTHHHLFQTLTRAVPGAQDAALFGWLQTLYPIWARFTPDTCSSRPRRAGGTGAVGLHDDLRSPLSLSQRRAARRHDRGRGRDRAAVSRHARRHVDRRERGRSAARQSGRGRGRDILNDCIRVIDRFHDPRPARWSASPSRPARPFRSAAS